MNIFSASARAPTASLREKMMLMDLASFEAISDDCKQINQVKIKNQTVANLIVNWYKAAAILEAVIS